MTQRVTLSLLFAALLTACGVASQSAPDLPESVSPGWKRNAITAAADVPGSAANTKCWTTQYTGPGTADVSVCRYKMEASAFDAVQRTPIAAQTVKFQENNFLVVLRWNGAPKASLTALIRALQKSLNSK